MNQFHELRRANSERQKEWDKGGHMTASYMGNEQAGEIGEALEAALALIQLGVDGGRASNVIKKLERESFGMPGSRVTIDDLANELGDIVICVDLVATRFGIDLWPAIVKKFNKTSEKNGFETMMEIF